mmetsp:Transcript_5494/g.20760  ORF Transcript_5494/g.20760 Transcript_5494/m.20760 type:complete len:305 (-) Transcript_5494:792-1706(-)
MHRPANGSGTIFAPTGATILGSATDRSPPWSSTPPRPSTPQACPAGPRGGAGTLTRASWPEVVFPQCLPSPWRGPRRSSAPTLRGPPRRQIRAPLRRRAVAGVEAPRRCRMPSASTRGRMRSTQAPRRPPCTAPGGGSRRRCATAAHHRMPCSATDSPHASRRNRPSSRKACTAARPRHAPPASAPKSSPAPLPRRRPKARSRRCRRPSPSETAARCPRRRPPAGSRLATPGPRGMPARARLRRRAVLHPARGHVSPSPPLGGGLSRPQARGHRWARRHQSHPPRQNGHGHPPRSMTASATTGR